MACLVDTHRRFHTKSWSFLTHIKGNKPWLNSYKNANLSCFQAGNKTFCSDDGGGKLSAQHTSSIHFFLKNNDDKVVKKCVLLHITPKTVNQKQCLSCMINDVGSKVFLVFMMRLLSQQASFVWEKTFLLLVRHSESNFLVHAMKNQWGKSFQSE